MSRQRIWSTLLALGACILIFRTLMMLFQDSLSILTWWAGALLIAEMIIDFLCLFACIRWWANNDKESAPLALRLGTAAALLHAIRILVFVLGKTQSLYNFDVKPEHHADHAETWTWFGVWFASIMATLGILGVIIIWRIRRRKART